MCIVSVLLVEEQILRLDTPVLIVTVRRNSECPETSSPVLVTFGARPANGGECVGQQNATARPIPPGATASFFVDAGSIFLGQDDIYCFIVILDEVPGEVYVTASTVPISLSFYYYYSGIWSRCKWCSYCQHH